MSTSLHHQENASAEDDLPMHLANLLDGTGVSPADTGGTITFAGCDPLFPSAVRLGSAFALSAMAAAVGAATIWHMRTGQGQDLFIDLRKAAHGINPELTFQPTVNGWPYPNPIGSFHPFTVFPYQTKDRRWVYPSAVYPAQQLAWTNFFNCGANHRSIAAAIARWNAEELEEAANAQGHTLCIARTAQEWASHPQGQYLAHEPVIAVRKIAESEPEPFGPATRPLSDIRVLSATHAVAGPVVGRTLAEQGAQVLQINRHDDFEHPWVYDDANVGFRSTFLDLNRPEANAQCRALAKQADVFVENYRGGKLAQFGFSPEQLAELRPGIIVVSVRCYGWGGPWAERGGFDMLGTAASGLAMLEGENGTPAVPPTALINDYVTGYMGAAGATAALIRRAKEGGSYHVTVSLTRNAMWYQSLGLIPPEERSFAENPFRHLEHLRPQELLAFQASLKQRLLDPDVLICETPLGQVRRLAPAVTYSATPASWNDPILTPMGASSPAWLSATHE
ncbi:MAG TPA: CoA transferase [Ktedonobacteraceae bacterium]|nr:CoA transferase [Ktedonobacteraceae bacterium]